VVGGDRATVQRRPGADTTAALLPLGIRLVDGRRMSPPLAVVVRRVISPAAAPNPVPLYKQGGRVQLPASAVYVTLPAFAAERRAAAPLLLRSPAAAAIDRGRYLLPAGPTSPNQPQ